MVQICEFLIQIIFSKYIRKYIFLINVYTFSLTISAKNVVRGLTIEGVNSSCDPLKDGIFHLPSPHALDSQILETVNNIMIRKPV